MYIILWTYCRKSHDQTTVSFIRLTLNINAYPVPAYTILVYDIDYYQ